MMKHILLAVTAAFCCITARADEPARISVNAGILAPYTLEATAGYEHPSGYGHSWCVFAEAGTHWQTPVCHMFWKKYFWDGGFQYKHRLVRFKNGSFRMVGGAYCGAFERRVYVGFEVGFEYNYTFANNWQISVSEKNSFNFLHDADTFRNGILIGVKIPLE